MQSAPTRTNVLNSTVNSLGNVDIQASPARKLIPLVAIIMSVGLVIGSVVYSTTRSAGLVKGFVMSQQERPRVRAPELTGGSGWLNTDRPLSIAALKGKVILLDFWTYGCINCMHIIPDLKRLEAKYPNQLVVIGVHSAKFKNEKETENIRRIILRYELEHPVYNDSEFSVWQSYGVRAWPTRVLIDPAGYIITNHHVAGHGTRMFCTLWNREEIEAELIGTDPLTDISIIKLKPNKPRTFTSMEFADSSALRVGDYVLAYTQLGTVATVAG